MVTEMIKLTENEVKCPNCGKSHKQKLLDVQELIDTDYIVDTDAGCNYDLFAEYQLIRCTLCTYVFELYRDELVVAGNNQKGEWRQVKLLKVNEGSDFNGPITFPVSILQGMVVLECDKGVKQGTAFKLNGIGFVTCSHVLGSNTKAIIKDNPAKKYDVNVITSNSDLDLALIDIPELNELVGFEPSWNTLLSQLDEVFIAGFPNYRLGDSGTIVTSAISGHRNISTIRRYLTSGPIIAGNSGGPILLRNGLVVGVAVTGADMMEEVHKTEDHGVIPIDTIKLLLEPQGS